MQQSLKGSYPDPWDDLEDYIDQIFWLNAIETGELKLLARYCRGTVVIDRSVLSALADTLDPKGAGPYYEWKKANGRPAAQAKPPSIAYIVGHLRDAPTIDPAVLSWLADQFDPDSPNDSHFVFKKARKRGRPLRRSRALREEVAVIVLGLRIEMKRREDAKLGPGYGKLEGALQHFVDGQDERYKPMTRSRARRAYDVFKNRITKK